MGAKERLAEEALYAQVATEIASGIRRDGLWAKAIAECGGSQERARAIYIRLRVQSLLDDAEVRRIAEVEERRQAEAHARLQEQERIDQRVAEIRELERRAPTIPLWPLVGVILVLAFVAYRLFAK